MGESSKKEPLGKPYIRGHPLKMLPEGFGNPSGEPEDCKKVVFPINVPLKDSEEDIARYKKSHNSFAPGERVIRGYDWPEASNDPYFRFGVAAQHGNDDGSDMKLALNCMAEDDGHFKQTKMVQRVCEDYRNVVRPRMGRKLHYVQGANGPPMAPNWAYGIKSITSDCTARSCILGYYSLDEQLPDQDLGRCTKVGRRNLTTHTRAFGVPSIRTDLEAPPERRSVADMTNYGDECGAAALMNPQRFDHKGVPDREFLLRRPKEELRELVDSSGPCMAEASDEFDEIYVQARDLFDDDQDLVSLDAFLYVYQQRIDERISVKHAGATGPVGKAFTA